MPRKSHPEEKIVYALRQAEAGKKVSDICREMGVSQQVSTAGGGGMPDWG
jgi:transposase-like protein